MSKFLAASFPSPPHAGWIFIRGTGSKFDERDRGDNRTKDFYSPKYRKKNFWPFLIPYKFLRKYLTFRPKMSRGTDNNDPK